MTAAIFAIIAGILIFDVMRAHLSGQGPHTPKLDALIAAAASAAVISALWTASAVISDLISLATP